MNIIKEQQSFTLFIKYEGVGCFENTFFVTYETYCYISDQWFGAIGICPEE